MAVPKGLDDVHLASAESAPNYRQWQFRFSFSFGDGTQRTIDMDGLQLADMISDAIRAGWQFRWDKPAADWRSALAPPDATPPSEEKGHE